MHRITCTALNCSLGLLMIIYTALNLSPVHQAQALGGLLTIIYTALNLSPVQQAQTLGGSLAVIYSALNLSPYMLNKAMYVLLSFFC